MTNFKIKFKYLKKYFDIKIFLSPGWLQLYLTKFLEIFVKVKVWLVVECVVVVEL